MDSAQGKRLASSLWSFSFVGRCAFGILAGEKGIRPLVRLSLFNNKALCQTNFASVELCPYQVLPNTGALEP